MQIDYTVASGATSPEFQVATILDTLQSRTQQCTIFLQIAENPANADFSLAAELKLGNDAEFNFATFNTITQAEARVIQLEVPLSGRMRFNLAGTSTATSVKLRIAA